MQLNHHLNKVAVNDGVELEFSAAKIEMPTSFNILYEGDIWICYIGASSHSTNDATGAKNI